MKTKAKKYQGGADTVQKQPLKQNPMQRYWPQGVEPAQMPGTQGQPAWMAAMQNRFGDNWRQQQQHRLRGQYGEGWQAHQGGAGLGGGRGGAEFTGPGGYPVGGGIGVEPGGFGGGGNYGDPGGGRIGPPAPLPRQQLPGDFGPAGNLPAPGHGYPGQVPSGFGSVAPGLGGPNNFSWGGGGLPNNFGVGGGNTGFTDTGGPNPNLKGNYGDPGGGYTGGPIPLPPQQPPGNFGPAGNLPYKIPSKSFYPQGMQAGTTAVQPIGTPDTQVAYGPPVNLSAPDILAHLQKSGKDAGLSKTQIEGLMEAFKGFSSGYNELSGGPGSAADLATAPTGAGYQGGISDIGYPPGIAPQAEFHGDRGGWIGRYDPMYTIPVYQRGTASVPLRQGFGGQVWGGGVPGRSPF